MLAVALLLPAAAFQSLHSGQKKKKNTPLGVLQRTAWGKPVLGADPWLPCLHTAAKT